MAENVIGTSSYSEAMDLSDLEDYYDQEESLGSPENISQTEQQQQELTLQYPEKSIAQDAPPVKIRKKPGRKPNPASPALRKAQNRAAQRAFRERKERHMKDLESNIGGIKDQRDRLLHENQKMSSENEILKAENWYLKGIVLSLQLVCLQHNLVIPQHCPHVNEKTLGILNQSIPESIASYINVNSKNKLQMSTKLMKDSPEISNIQLQHQQRQQQQQQQYAESVRQPQQFRPQPIPQQLPSGSLIITQDDVNTIPDKRLSNQPQPTSWYHQANNNNKSQSAYSTSEKNGSQYSSNNTTSTMNHSSPHPSEDESLYYGILPSSPISTADREKVELSPRNNNDMPLPQPAQLANEPVISNLAAIQALRLRLRLQSACVRMQSVPFAIQPTLLQLTIPHDPRIDLIPTPHMRDRMILYREQFDLDDCLRCLLSGSVFHGGDPAIAGNWQLPVEFFDKYWFLTIDYNLRRYTNEWRKLQGLKEIKSNIMQPPSSETSNTLHQTRQQSWSPPPLSPLIPTPQQPVFNHPNQHNIQNKPVGGLGYEDLSGYLGGSGKNQQSQSSQQQQQGTNMPRIQLTNGYGMVNTSSSNAAASKSIPASSTSPWDNLMMGQKNYDLMMAELYNSNNNNDMDQRSH